VKSILDRKYKSVYLKHFSGICTNKKQFLKRYKKILYEQPMIDYHCLGCFLYELRNHGCTSNAALHQPSRVAGNCAFVDLYSVSDSLQL